eukprot:COSAG02_NODE_134_length_34593_cov_43.594886_22_plen_149_part_00
MQRTAQNYGAYGQSQRSSRVTADVVYRLGRVPKPVDVKTTIGTMPRRQRGRGRRSQYGGVLELTDVVMQDLRSYAKQEKLDVPIGTKAALVCIDHQLQGAVRRHLDVVRRVGRAQLVFAGCALDEARCITTACASSTPRASRRGAVFP